MADLGISPLEIKDRHLLEEGLFSWSSRNNSDADKRSIELLVSDLFEASDTTVFQLHNASEVVGVFMWSMSMIVSKSVAGFSTWVGASLTLTTYCPSARNWRANETFLNLR